MSAVFTPLLVAFLSQSAAATGWTQCNTGETADEVIAGCTAVLGIGETRSTDRARAHNNRGLAHLKAGRHADAIEDFNQAIAFDNTLAVAFFNRALANLRRGDFDQALPDLIDTIRLDPQSATAWSVRSQVWYAKRQYDKAISDASKAIRIKPNNALAHINRARAYNAKRQYNRAIADLTKAMRLNPHEATAYLNRARAYHALKRFDQAIADIDRLLEYHPNDATGYNFRGRFKLEKQDLAGAISDFSEAVLLNPDYAIAWHNLGYAHWLSQNVEKAIANLNKAVTLNPRYAYSYLFRGLSNTKLSRYTQAIADLSQAMRLDPRDSRAYAGRAEAYAATGQIDRALADMDMAMRLAPGNIKLTAKRARIAGLAKPASSASALHDGTAASTKPGLTLAPGSLGKRVALVIGNAKYAGVKELANPPRDAKLVASAFTRAGFTDVTLLYNLDQRSMRESLIEFTSKAETADWAVVYFAGHGIEVDGRNYLIPVDARLRNARHVSLETVPLSDVMDAAGAARKFRLIILDACRDNPFRRSMKTAGTTRSVGRGLARVEPTGGTLVAYAAREGQLALDGNGANSPFAKELVRYLDQPGLEIGKLFRRTRDAVLKLTDGRQEPFTYGSLPGEDLYFRPPAN